MSNHTALAAPGPLYALPARLHFYIGLLVGPFLLVAALSGIFYALTPQLPLLGWSLVCLIIWDALLCIRRTYATFVENKA